MHYHHQAIGESRDDAHHKISVIALSHTVIKPHAMMVEFIHTSVAGTTVLAICHTITLTVLAVQHFTIVRSK
jgi:hypothetical protein